MTTHAEAESPTQSVSISGTTPDIDNLNASDRWKVYFNGLHKYGVLVLLAIVVPCIVVLRLMFNGLYLLALAQADRFLRTARPPAQAESARP